MGRHDSIPMLVSGKIQLVFSALARDVAEDLETTDYTAWAADLREKTLAAVFSSSERCIGYEPNSLLLIAVVRTAARGITKNRDRTRGPLENRGLLRQGTSPAQSMADFPEGNGWNCEEHGCCLERDDLGVYYLWGLEALNGTLVSTLKPPTGGRVQPTPLTASRLRITRVEAGREGVDGLMPCHCIEGLIGEADAIKFCEAVWDFEPAQQVVQPVPAPSPSPAPITSKAEPRGVVETKPHDCDERKKKRPALKAKV